MLHKLFSFWRPAALVLCALLLTGVFVQPAAAQDREADIRRLLQQRDRQIKSVLGDRDTFTPEQRAQLKDLINGMIDFRAMSRRTLGSYWSGLSAQQQDAFVDVFSTIVRAHSLSNLDAYRASVTIEEITVDGDEAHVVTRTVYEGRPIPVEYDLILTDEGWRATDIFLDDDGSVGGYQRSFQTVVRKKGFDALMQSLHEKEAEITGGR